MNLFEALMLICFGISWPISIAKSIRTKTVAGKSPLFMSIVVVGYSFGIIHKILYSYDWVLYLYILNLCMVSIDILLYFKYLSLTEITKIPENPQYLKRADSTTSFDQKIKELFERVKQEIMFRI